MLYSGLSHTSSRCSHSSSGSYWQSQAWSRSRRRTSSGLPSPQAASEAPQQGNRASRPTEDEDIEGRLRASSPLAMSPPDFVVLFWISRGVRTEGRQWRRALNGWHFRREPFKIKDAPVASRCPEKRLNDVGLHQFNMTLKPSVFNYFHKTNKTRIIAYSSKV